eukprot:1139345-Pelagomonas_calceolata.AAC.5
MALDSCRSSRGPKPSLPHACALNGYNANNVTMERNQPPLPHACALNGYNAYNGDNKKEPASPHTCMCPSTL